MIVSFTLIKNVIASLHVPFVLFLTWMYTNFCPLLAMFYGDILHPVAFMNVS